MKSRSEARSEYWFDPTATRAVKNADRKIKPPEPVRFIVERASSSDIKKYEGVTFTPDTPTINARETFSQVRAIEDQRNALIRTHGRHTVQTLPEFQDLTAELFRAQEIHAKALAAKRR